MVEEGRGRGRVIGDGLNWILVRGCRVEEESWGMEYCEDRSDRKGAKQACKNWGYGNGEGSKK